MNKNLGLKIWKSELNPYYKRNSYIFFSLVVCVLVLPILIFPIHLFAGISWRNFFYILIYSIFSPIAILFLLTGLTFSRKYLIIYENCIKFRTKIFNPFSKKEILLFNQIKDVKIDHKEPINYKNKVSKFLLYDMDSCPSIKTTGDYTILLILTENEKLYKIRESFISDSKKVKNLILKQKSVAKEIPLKIKLPKTFKKAKQKTIKPKTKTRKVIEKEKIAVDKQKVKKSMIIESKDDRIKYVLDNYCKYCGTLLSGPKTFCIKCGKKVSGDLEREDELVLINYCKNCGTKILGSSRFCMKCGKKIS